MTTQHITPLIDLRSDVLAPPTEAMWEAMRAAPLGWAVAGEDQSVQELEATGAALVCKEAALFVPTGSMANLVALMSHTQRGDQVIVESASHIYWSEEWSFASICGVAARALEGVYGYIEPNDIRQVVLDQRFSHRPQTSLICLENTHNMAGGTILSPAQTASIAAVAAEFGVALHLDGARLFNASVALNEPLHAFTDGVDSVVLNLNKGLSAPEGALLCGTRAWIETARLNLKRLGGGSLHKAGIFAAAGLTALQTMIPQLAEDHRRARWLATELARIDGVHIDLSSVQTNIVMATMDETGIGANALLQQLRQQNIRATLYRNNTIRFTLHRQITDEAIHRVIAAIQEIVAQRS